MRNEGNEKNRDHRADDIFIGGTDALHPSFFSSLLSLSFFNNFFHAFSTLPLRVFLLLLLIEKSIWRNWKKLIKLASLASDLIVIEINIIFILAKKRELFSHYEKISFPSLINSSMIWKISSQIPRKNRNETFFPLLLPYTCFYTLG